VLERLYEYCDVIQENGGEHLAKFLRELYIVPKYIPKSHVSASCNLRRGVVSLNIAPGQPVIEGGSGITEYPMAGNPAIKRDVDKYMGKGLIEGIQMAEEELEKAEPSKEEAESIVRDIYHEMAHEVVFYRGLKGRDPVKEEGTVIFLENFWLAYRKLLGKVKPEEFGSKVKGEARKCIIDELRDLKEMPKNTPEDARYYANKLLYLQNAILAYSNVEDGAKPEDLIFSDYLLSSVTTKQFKG